VLDDAERSKLSPIRVEEAHVRLLRQLYQEAVQAARAGIFSVRADHRLVRLPVTLDRLGWEEAVRIHTQVLSDTLAARRESLLRLEAAPREEPIKALAAILCFPRCADAVGSGGGIPRRRSTMAKSTAGSSYLEREALAATDPARMTIVTALTLSPASATELAGALGMPLARIRYEISRLTEAGFVRVYGERPRRGTVERIYFAEGLRETYDHGGRVGEEIAARKRADVQVVNALFREAVEATRAGHFETPTESVVARIPMRLDDRGIAEIAEVFGAALEELLALREESHRRLAASKSPEVQATLSLMLFGKPDREVSRNLLTFR